MKATEFRSMSEGDLTNKIASLEENLLKLRCNKTLGQLEDTSVIGKAKKDIARAKTVLNDKLTIKA